MVGRFKVSSSEGAMQPCFQQYGGCTCAPLCLSAAGTLAVCCFNFGCNFEVNAAHKFYCVVMFSPAGG